MIKEVPLRRAGGSIAATLPKEMANRLNLEAGYRASVVETEEDVLLTSYDPKVETSLPIARRVAKKYG